MEYNKLLEKARKLGVSVDTYKFLRSSNRKMRYFTHDLKRQRIIIENETITFIPSREDSLERLAEDEGIFFTTAESSVEDAVIGKMLLEQLYRALDLLEPCGSSLKKCFSPVAVRGKVSEMRPKALEYLE